jgi:serine/threonine protein kinase
MPLPRKVGPFTLMRKLASDTVAETFVAILDAPAGKQVVVRKLLPVVTRDEARQHALRTRIGDLRSVRPHPNLAPVLSLQDVDGDTYVVEEQAEGVELSSVLAAAAARGVPIPHNVYLHLAAQLCNALEALHANGGIETGSEHVLHLAVAPSAMWVTSAGHLTLGRHGLTRSPTAFATHATGTMPISIEYLSPEQTHQDQKLTPASDLFSLGAVLYELLTFKSLFRAESNLQTIHRIRRAEVTTQLLEVKEILPGLDKVLFRSLSLNARHRYQRAFVLREDLRGLMAGYSFSDIEAATRDFLEPTIAAIPSVTSAVDGSALGREFHGSNAGRETTAALLRGVPESLRDSPLSEPRDHAPGAPDLHEPSDPYAPDTDALLHDDTAALLGGDTASRPTDDQDRRENTAWNLNLDRRPLEELPSRPLEAIDTTQRGRDELEAPSLPPRLLPELEPFGATDARGDTIPMHLETTRPSPDDGDTGVSWPTRPPGLAPPSLPPEPTLPPRGRAPDRFQHQARSELPSGELRSADLVPDSGALPDDPPSAPLAAPFDFAASLAEDTGLNPVAKPPAPLDLRPPPGAPQEARASALGPSDSLTAPYQTPPPAPDARPSPPGVARSESIDPESWAPEPAGRSFLGPVVGLGLVTLAAALGVFTCVGGGGMLGILGLRGARGPEVVAVEPAPTRPAPIEAAPPAPAPPPEPPPEAVAVAPEPPTPVAAPPAPPREPTARQRQLELDLRPPTPAPPREVFEAVSAAPRPAPRPPPPPPPEPLAPTPEPAAPSPVVAAELDAWSSDAFAGALGSDARSRLGTVPATDGEYTRAQTLLLLDAKARGDAPARSRAMDALMAQPENRYSPALLVEQAQILLEQRQWKSSLEAARKAEQHWARLPPELVWSRKTMMYELQALANTGLFYDSEGEDLATLQAAIRDWERYRRHVATKDRKDLIDRADASLRRLNEIQTRLEGGTP